MKYKGISVLIYAFLVLIGGILGYVKAQSAVSLMTGVLSSMFLCASAFGILKERTIGFFFASLLTLALGIFFTYRLIQTHSFMPAGMMCILSLIVLIILFSPTKTKSIEQSN